MRKNKQESNASKDLTVKALLSDVFGLNRTEEQKARSRKEIPWQWALWGALLFFCVGFLVPTESLWIILLAIGVAVIVYMARASESVEPQVFLLTDNRSAEQKANFERRNNKARPRRPARTKTDKTETAEADKNAEQAKDAKPAPKPRKPRVSKPKAQAVVDEVKVEEKVEAAPIVEAAEQAKPVAEVKSEVVAEEAKPKAKPRPRRPRAAANGASRASAPRRPRKPKNQSALTSTPVASDKAE